MDSLWDVAGSELRDWETMTAFLLQDRGEERDKTKERPVCVFSGLLVTDISRQPTEPGFCRSQSLLCQHLEFSVTAPIFFYKSHCSLMSCVLLNIALSELHLSALCVVRSDV